uniref:hypothetical protein n=1 Tax=Nonomuraea pusilla TaxID=46177 RepID=UPI0006E1EDB8|nr:hypothetical protein [Nonomuraea pusilla]
MLKSQAGRRFARKTSVLGLLGTGVLFAGSAFTLLTATEAQAATPKTYAYTCSGGPFTNTAISVTVTPPDSATAGGNFELALGIPALMIASTSTPQTTNLQVTATLTPTPGSVFDAGAKTGPSVPSAATSVLASEVKYKISVPTGSTGSVSVKPGELRLALASSSTSVTTCTTTSTEAVTVPIGTGGGGGTTGTDVVQYECTGPTASEVHDVEVKVELTMPTSAKVGEQFAIKWKGTYTTGKELKAPSTGQTISPKIFAYAALTGVSGLTSATGEGTTTVTAGQPITLPVAAFDLKATANTAGTATVKPGKINFGADTATGTTPAISCTVQNDTALKTYTLTVGAATSPTSSSTTTSSPKPTKTTTAYVTVTPSATKSKTKQRNSQTPKAGADTGAGGEMGPDGRVFILTGSALVAAAAVGGLWMRRRGVSRS